MIKWQGNVKCTLFYYLMQLSLSNLEFLGSRNLKNGVTGTIPNLPIVVYFWNQLNKFLFTDCFRKYFQYIWIGSLDNLVIHWYDLRDIYTLLVVFGVFRVYLLVRLKPLCLQDVVQILLEVLPQKQLLYWISYKET